MFKVPPPPPAGIVKSLQQTTNDRYSLGAGSQKLANAAHAFEEMAISQLLQPMFETVQTSTGLLGGGAGEDAWKPMLVQEFAKQIGAHGGLGLAKPVYNAMLLIQEVDRT